MTFEVFLDGRHMTGEEAELISMNEEWAER